MCRLAEKAADGSSATIKWLASVEHLPRKYLEQVLRDLKRAHLVDSRPGPGGGCRLGRAASEITVGDIVRALDGDLAPGHCLEHGGDPANEDCPGCWGSETCAMRELWTGLQTAFNEVLDSVTVEELVARQHELAPAPTPEYQI